ncbi:MAG: tetratricopeptide repeat protein [Proteobacteria bacterium]|nr:tetratricopeptide repeat protein [Pseudomonadota bacterium]
MTPEKYKKIKEILVQVLQKPKENQIPLLNELCGSEQEIKTAVEKLLKLDDSKHSSLMEVPAIVSQLPNLEIQISEEEIPTHIKQYKILEKIGSGGMGNVYLALQSYPAERQVAIKILKALPNQQRLFEETQILAKLNHPNIATLYEVDTTDDGQLFIVMELIEGQNIIQWCKDRHFSIKQKVKLFRQLCTGISYAHVKGIIHCDIKPYNVQVTTINDTAVVKIIDFGISQYQDNQLNTTEIAGTPAYLAPEILEKKDNGITDTRRDVYALGVLLNKLLPVEKPADLSAIIEKAMAHDKSDRYASALSLKDDLNRYLEKRIVKARQRTFNYVSSRFVQRNVVLVIFIFTLFLSLVGGFVAQSIQANKAKMQAKIAIEHSKTAKVAQLEAEELSDFLVGLFNLSNPERVGNNEITANDLINKANDKLLDLKNPTLSDARFMHTIGSIFTRMDQLEKSKTIVEKSLEVKQSKLDANDDEIISSITQLGLIHRRLKNNDKAESYLIKAIELHESRDKPNLSQLAYTHNHLGNLYWQKNDIEQSIYHHNNALELRKQTGENRLLADSYNNLGAIYKRSKQWDLSQYNLDEALALYRNFYDEDHPYIAFALNNLGTVEEHRFNWKTAEELYVKTFTSLKNRYGKSHQNTLVAQITLAIFYSKRMRFQESIELRKQAIKIYREKGNLEKVAKQLNRTAYDLYYLGEIKQAKQFHEQAISTIKDVSTKDEFLQAKLNIDYAALLIEQGKFELAKRNLNQSLGELESHSNNKYFYSMVAMNLLADILFKQDKYKEATKLFNKVIQLSDDKSKANQRQVIKAYVGIGKSMAELNKFSQANENFQSGLKVAHKNYGEKHQLIALILFEMGRLELSQNHITQAKSLLQQALTMQKTVLPEKHKNLIETKTILNQLKL